MTERQMGASEFISRILKRETQLRDTVLKNADLMKDTRYSTFLRFLESEYTPSGYGTGLNLEGSRLEAVTAPNLILCGAILDGAQIKDFNAVGGQIAYANFNNSRIENLSVQRGALSCCNFKNARINGLNIANSQFFENGFSRAVLFNLSGTDSALYVSTTGISDLIVDPQTFETLGSAFPKHFPLQGRSITRAQTLEDGTLIPEGSMLLNAKYYLKRFMP